MTEKTEITGLRSAIEALEKQRGILGDQAVDTSVSVLKEKLAGLEGGSAQGEQLRRYVSVLFADVSGFTAICSRNDAENVTEALNSLWNSLDSIIMSFGGTVDKHIGDCVMAVWGVNGVREDDAVRAVEAALAMQKASQEISTGSDGLIPPFRIRIGIHSGPVFISGIGLGDEYTVMGDTVNVASRLQSIAPLGSVLVGQTVRKHLGNRFFCREQPPARVKGIDGSLSTFLVTGKNTVDFMGLNTAFLGAETKMVGREKELSVLLDGFSESVEKKRPVMITVSGDAGIGKSRLLHEFRRALSRSSERIVFYNARCTPGMEDIRCSVFRDVLRFSFRVLESDTAEVALDKLSKGMCRYIGEEDAHLAALFAGFDTSTSPFFSPGETEPKAVSRGRNALLQFFREAACSGSALFYLEDLHWADSVSLDLIEELASPDSPASILLLCLARPPLFVRRPDWGKTRQGELIELTPLSSDESRRMVRGLLGRLKTIPGELDELITSNADGNPFYVEELIKMLAEDGTIDTNSWQVNTVALTAGRIPSTLTGVLQARLDSLPGEERTILQMASVVGRVFWDLAVGDLYAAGHGGGVEDLLSATEKRDLIHRSMPSSFQSSSEYLFKHAILRDVTYETVLLKARKIYHRVVARWLISNAKDRSGEFEGLIAGHFEKGEDWENALQWLLKAGDSAMRACGFTEAVSIFERALKLPEGILDDALRADLHVKLGGALEKLSEYARAETELEKALVIARRGKLYSSETRALSTLAWVMTVTGRRARADELAVMAMKAAENSGDRSLQARALMRMADAEKDRSYEKVLSYFTRALAIYRETADRRGTAIALLNMGNTAIAFNDLEKAFLWYSESLELYTGNSDRWGIANCLSNLGSVAMERKEAHRALELYQKSLEVSRSIGDREGEAICNLNLGDTALLLNDPHRALGYFKRSAEVSSSTGLKPLLLAALRGEAQVFRLQGQLDLSAFILFHVSEDEALEHFERKAAENILCELRNELSSEEYHRAEILARGALLEDVLLRISDQ